MIDIRAERLASRVCPNCGNNVLFDQTQGEDALCPVCHERINTRESMKMLVQFTCPSCACTLTVDKNTEKYVCPLCDTEIDVQKRIRQQEVKNQEQPSIIKYEGGSDVLVWKHPIEDFNFGSQLIVHESQEAILLRDGVALDTFGAGRYTLATESLPELKANRLPSDSAVFHSEVYFVNLATQMGVKWGTDSKVRMFDPASGLHIDLGACGSFSMRVADSRKLLLKLVGASSALNRTDVAEGFDVSHLVGQFKALIINKVKANLARAIRESGINILEIDEYLDVLSDKLRGIIELTLEEYGLAMPEFYITNVLTPDDDPNFKRLKQQFADKTLLVRQEQIRKAEAEAAQERKLVEAQTDARLKMVDAQGEAEALKIKAQAEAEAYRAKALAEAEEMKAKGYTYQQETARQVGTEAMKNGLTGNGAGNALGDLAALGMTMGAMGDVIGMTKQALDPSGKTEPAPKDAWDCPECGAKGITSKFCPECGTKKPETPAAWICPNCGATGITTKFCPECGAKKPEVPAAWDCPNCGKKGITSKFCPECGTPK